MNILITGGTGLIGQRLVNFLSEMGMSLRLMSRKANVSATVPRYEWDIKAGSIDENALKGVDVVIHLAGANIAEGRWTDRRKKEILNSRINSTQLLYQAIESMDNKPKTLIGASATGFYGFRDFEHESKEDENPGTDFLARVCSQWEAEVDRFSELGLSVVKLRTGVVFDSSGGALQKMTQPIRYFAGAALGSGQQYIPWIHWEDWCGAVAHLLQKDKLSGTFNLVAPEPVTNAELTRLIAKIIRRPLILPNVPVFMLKMLLGEMSSVVLYGHKMSSTKLVKSGYQFKYELIGVALSELLGQD